MGTPLTGWAVKDFIGVDRDIFVRDAETTKPTNTGTWLDSYTEFTYPHPLRSADGPLAVPVNTTLPTITGSANVSSLLTAQNGSWTGNPTPTFTYQWRTCDSSGATCTNISGATAKTYVLVQNDLGKTIRVIVTGTNSAGNAAATSAQTSTVSSQVPAPPVTPPTVGDNVAASAFGGLATASSTSSGFSASKANDGFRDKGTTNGTNYYWLDSTDATWPDWLVVTFNNTYTIGTINVVGVQDDYGNPINPTLTTTSTLYGLKDYLVQYWDGTTWQTVPGGTITNNDKVWKQITLDPPISTDKIRVYVTDSQETGSTGSSAVVEMEAIMSEPGGSGGGAAPSPVMYLLKGGG